MSNKKQTAVTFLVDWLKKHSNGECRITYQEAVQKAKEMEKEQIVEHHTWLLSGVMGEISAREDAEQYYKETYGE